MTKKVDVYKVEYEISNRPNESWEAYIAGFDVESVHKYLEGYVQGGSVSVNTVTTMGRLDSVTDDVREFIAQPFIGKKINSDAEDVETDESTPVKKRPIVPKG